VGEPFNAVLANLYRNGRDSMGWHADDEPELGPRPLIASVSFGATRRFCLRDRSHRDRPIVELELAPGSLLVLERGIQSRYQHSLPKTRKSVEARVNLTFRQVQCAAPHEGAG
jgi:alkylated DNA repair dioxygenase AlkB